jgi:hypothetical protein
MIIAVDFDGTCVSHEFPQIGTPIGAPWVLRRLVESGHQLILHTMRSGEGLDDAVNWFKELEIPLFGINQNPTQHTWTSSPKPYANLYIDDAALGVPLIFNKEVSERPYVDWNHIEFLLQKEGLFNKK